MTQHVNKFSIVLPAKNEAKSLKTLLPNLRDLFPEAEIIVVNDGSTDNTVKICQDNHVICITHAYSMGNGAAIKTGARIATGDIIVFMDADGQHDPGDITHLLAKIDDGHEMVVGARTVGSQSSLARRIANTIYNRLASYMTEHDIQDLTSGFRAVRARHFLKFLYMLPNGFSYPTTSTMAFFRSGLPVAYVPIQTTKRTGKSHIKLLKDGFRFFVIILKIGSLFSPMRFFLTISAALLLTGVFYYAYTFLLWHLSLMQTLLFS